MTIYGCKGIASPVHHGGGFSSFFKSIVGAAQDAISGDDEYYATVDLGTTRVGRTRVLKESTSEPVWNESFRIYCCHSVPDLTISVKDGAIVGTVVIGRAKIPAESLLSGEPVEDWYQLYKGDEQINESQIRFRMQFYEASHDPHWGLGISDSRYKGVPYCYYPQRRGCKVTLYQDAHMEDGFLPPIYQSGGQKRQPTHCWEDVFDAIMGARHLIYITGWSVYCETVLVRDPRRPKEGAMGLTLGELLKKKAKEGVRVNMLVWDDKTSVEFMKRDGLMATHDEDTEAYFQDSEVNCFLCPRSPDDSLSKIQGLTIGTMFTHHQKTIIVDAPLPGSDTGRRRIMSFVGGIDLCDGRYDNQNHSLFRTLNDVNMNDFHQPNYPETSAAKGGPREPWHDIHARVEGPVAWDVLWNFEQRWRMQAKEDRLIPIKEIDTIDPPSAVAEQDDPDTWSVQLFRSIDAGAAYGFPEDPETIARAGLTSGKNNTIDRSIQDAYINAIRRAKDFIYIENQYFLGSCYAWSEDQDAGAFHTIPMELTRKIVSKIEDGERFAVYVVVPMWPEGIPESGSVQAILDWQKKTMEMMYTQIANALRAQGIDDQSPRDYLTFFCLANRETKVEGEYEPTESPEEGSNYAAAQAARRFMIYVHSKFMIVDDEYTIIGSANINQRSMDGSRDSEIAIGAYQPYHLSRDRPPRSHIHGFRMSCWYEHIGKLDNAFLKPWDLECIRKVNRIADQHWEMFAGDEIVDMPGHLCSYPIVVNDDGTITNIPGLEHFPDTQAPILGTKSGNLPSILTT